MKTRYITYLALPLMLASAWSCTDLAEDAVNEVSGGSTVKEIVLQLPELKTADTRTEFTVDEVNKTLKTAWKEGDVAGIFPTTGYNQVEFPISDAWGESVARFDGGDWALRANKSYAAYFPFNKANFERDATSIILSYEGQVQSENGSVSHLSDYDYLATGAVQSDPYGSIYFQMQRLSGIVRLVFTLPADEAAAFTKLVLLADEEVFDVKKSLDITGSIPQLGAAESSRSISMNLNNIYADENHQLIVYMTLPPMSTNGQVKFNLMKDNGDLLIATSSGFSVEAGKVQGYAFSDYIPFEDTIIAFEDESVKTICVKNWDLNGDGELGMTEASVVSSLDLAFKNNRDITSFNELQFFVNVKYLDSTEFKGCTNLKTIVLPDNMDVWIGDYCFMDCVSLESIFIPEGITSIGVNAFGFCDSLESVIIPNSFSGVIGEFAFHDCNKLNEIVIPEGVTSIGLCAFIGCSSINSIVVNAMSPIALGKFAFDATGGCPIYVPANSVNAYKEAWTEYADRIQAIQ